MRVRVTGVSLCPHLQLLREVLAVNDVTRGVTFSLLQLGHRILAFARSVIVKAISNSFLHFSQLNA